MLSELPEIGDWRLLLGLALLVFALRHLFSKLILAHRRKSSGCGKLKKYPHLDPFLGSDLYVKFEKSKRTNTLQSTVQKILRERGNGKTVQTLTWGVPTILTSDERIIQPVLTSHFANFGVEPIRLVFNEPWMGPGVLNSDGQIWKEARCLIKPFFARTNWERSDVLDGHVTRLLARMPREPDGVDIMPWLYRAVRRCCNYRSLLTTGQFIDIGSHFIFGESASTLSTDSRFDADEYLAALDRALEGVQRRVVRGSLNHYLPIDRQWLKSCQIVHQLFDSYIETAIREHNEVPKEQCARVLDDRAILPQLVEQIQDTQYIRDQLISLFLPFHNTAAIGFGDLLFNLARHREVWRKLRTELLGTIRGTLTLDSVRSLPYLRAVVKEGLGRFRAQFPT